MCAELCTPLSEDVKEWGWQWVEEGDDALGSGSDCVLNWFVSLCSGFDTGEMEIPRI